MDDLYHILILVSLLAPLASFLTVGLIAASQTRLISTVSILFLFLGFVSATWLLLDFQHQLPLFVSWQWFNTGAISFTLDFALTARSTLMLAVVSLISFLVHLYSTEYMAGDPNWKRYFAMLGFFTFSMQGIVLSENLLLIFIFWELVGFSSYMLIGHWTSRPDAGRAATKAFVLNRIGDAGFLVGLMIIWATHASFNLSTIIQASGTSEWQTAAALCIFCGIIGKSAQFPLFTWLPAAMEGPTPVSALIHAATMVAAGVYLLINVFPIFTEDALVIVAITGMITTLVGALAALSQYDIKKILAYSTMSQLGLMILAIGMGVVDAAFLHLITHAFFKACLFLSAGMVIHAIHQAQTPQSHFDVQDIRNLGGLRKRMPVTFALFAISAASLAGVPFFSGFLSKEAILTALFMHTDALSWWMFVVIISVSFLTVLYTFRLIGFIFLGEERTIRPLALTDPPLIMQATAGILALGSLWFIVSWNPFDFAGWLVPRQENTTHSLWITVFSILWVTAALALGWYIFKRGSFKTNHVLRNSFYVDKGFTAIADEIISNGARGVTWIERCVIDRSIHGLAYGQVILAHVVAWIDRVFVDGTVNGTARLAGFSGKITRTFQGGNIQLYIFWAVFGIIIFIIWTLK